MQQPGVKYRRPAASGRTWRRNESREKSWRPVRCKRWPLFQNGWYHIASCVCYSARGQKPTTRRAPSPSGRPKPGPVLDSLDRLKGLGPKSNDDAARRFRTTRPCSGPGVVGAGTNGRQAGCLCFCVSSWFVSVSVTSKSTVQSLVRPCCRDL